MNPRLRTARRLVVPFSLAMLAVTALFTVACSQSSESPIDPSGAYGGTTTPAGTSCDVPNTGCACADEGSLTSCGEVKTTTPDGRLVCAVGVRRCMGGAWSRCDALQNVTPNATKGGVIRPLNLPADEPTSSCNDPCDPQCKRAADAPDGGTAAETGAAETWDAAADGAPPNPKVSTYLNDAGITLDGAIYHEIPPTGLALDPLKVSTKINAVDVYFLLNSTVSTKSSIDQLATQIPAVAASIQSTIPSAAFGVGRFTNYQSWPYGSQESGNVVYQNRVNVSTDATLIATDLTYMKNNPTSIFVNTPYVDAQSTIPALYAMATNETLRGYVSFTYPGTMPSDWWWNTKAYYGQRTDAALQSPYATASAACTGGGVGAPCFRPDAFHIVMLLQDAPMMNGPGGSFPYYQMKPQYFPWNAGADYTTENSWFWYDSPSLGASGPTLPTSNGATQSLTIPTASVGKPQIYTGNVSAKSSLSALTALSVYAASAQQRCTIALPALSIGTGPDVSFDFTVTQANTRYWFDTVGSAYDTLLYLVNTSNNQIMGCMDDSFAWLSAVAIGGVGTTDRNVGKTNSALIGTLQPGTYRLVLDKTDSTAFTATTLNRGLYQLNAWMDIDDPRQGGLPRGSALTTPGYSQTLRALRTSSVNAMVTSLEMSGVTCGQTAGSWEDNWTRWSLEQLATDTGAVVNGVPVVYSIKKDGSPGPVTGPSTTQCPASASLGTIVADAISNLTSNLSQSVTATAVDLDDRTDFDGVSGVNAGPTVLTPTNIDDTTFVASITANPVTGCTGASGASYASCLPGAQPNFTVRFAVPPTVTARSVPQIFRFQIDLTGFAGAALSSTTVVLVVPPVFVPYVPTDFVRDFDASGACRSDQSVVWGVYDWDSTEPGDSSIDFYARGATTLAGLDTATEITPAFATAKSPGSQQGAQDVGAAFKAAGVIKNSRFARIRARINPTSDRAQTAVLNRWDVAVTCVDSQ